uniref:Phage Tail Protein X n=1 Tax=Candidatus Kentrum sp. LPFa TaxID=2126335 RepID=A0A450WK69_9GAMM|nr:MAG: Phage Tail Protein X [Candidatus Kentron sp. LPFa]
MKALEHITKEGERWDQLAHRYYGDAMAYGRILEANPDMRMSPVLPGGLALAIPLVEQEDKLESAEAPPWKR